MCDSMLTYVSAHVFLHTQVHFVYICMCVIDTFCFLSKWVLDVKKL